MIKIISTILVFTMLLSFSGCRASGMFDTQPSNDLALNHGTPSETASETPTEEIPTETNTPTDAPTQPPVTTPPATEPPTTPPVTDPPATEPPTTPPVTDPPATEHTHSWVNATCTAAKTCSTCNATEGAAAGHKWCAATCTTPKTCSICQVTEGSTADHSWSDATCTAPKTCSKCEATSGDKLSHDFQDGACVVCESRQLGYGDWYFVKQEGDTIYLYIFYFKDGNGSGNVWCEVYKDESKYPGTLSHGIIYEGKRYTASMGAGDSCYYEASDDEITIHLGRPEDNWTQVVTLQRIDKDQMLVTNVIDDFWYVEDGRIFTYDCVTRYRD